MKPWLLVFLALFCAACSTVVRDGRTVEHAVRPRAKNQVAGIKAEFDWMQQHLPGARLAGGVATTAGDEVIHLGHRTEVHGPAIFSVYEMQLPDGSVRDVYFDQRDYFGK